MTCNSEPLTSNTSATDTNDMIDPNPNPVYLFLNVNQIISSLNMYFLGVNKFIQINVMYLFSP